MEPTQHDELREGIISRRQFLRMGGAAGLTIAAGGLLAACTTETASTTVAPTIAGTTGTTGPVRGGRLRVGLVGGGPSEALDPNVSVSYIDDARNFALFEGLTKRRLDGSGTELNLAKEFEPNADGTVWTAVLHDDVVFHNGKTMTADDVIFSYRYILDEANGSLGRPLIADFIDPSGLRKVDDMTVEIGLKIPYFLLPFSLAEQRVRIFPEGTTSFDSPVGTGPFKFESWAPGQRSLFVRNDQYRTHDGPFVEELEYISIDEAAARLNALQAGQIDALAFLEAAQIGTVEADPELQVFRSPSMGGPRFVMDVQKPPFDDVRVRQAFRLLIDRQQILDTVFLGEGIIGNDLSSLGDPDYAREIPQTEYDPERAKALLKDAGVEGLTVELHAGNVGNKLVEMATLYSEQAKAGGVNIEVKEWPADQYWSGPYLNRPLFSTDWAGRPLVPQFFMATMSEAPFNETNWRRPDFDKQVLDAIATPDETKRRDRLVEVQRLLSDEGGYIIPVFTNFVDAMTINVSGVVPSVFWPLGNFEWLDTTIQP